MKFSFPFLSFTVTASLLFGSVSAAPQPLIYDTDHGPFIDDIFALGLLLNSNDKVDMQVVMATSEDPALSALCIAAQMELSGFDLETSSITVAEGETLPPYEERGSVCGIPGILGFGIEPVCRGYFNETGTEPVIEENGVEYVAQLLMESDRDDWWYLVVGGQTSLKRLIEEFPEAAAKIDTLVVMAGNWCADFEPYPDVMAPTDETNIGCDPAAANYVLNAENNQFNNVYYVPVVVADEIGGEDYAVFVEAAESGEQPVASATLDFYKFWSDASRADPDLLVHLEAMTYDPATESTPQFDAMAVMLVLELLSPDICGADGRIAHYQFEAVHFFETTDEGLQPFPEAPRSAYSVFGGAPPEVLPDQCPNITTFTFDPDETPEMEYPIQIALGFHSQDGKDGVFADMARRLAGDIVLCESMSGGSNATDAPTVAPTSESTMKTASLWLFSIAGAIAMIAM